ncbi:hypothetical protein BH11MYX1_BH11MYX1_38620 [soil metagenome]
MIQVTNITLVSSMLMASVAVADEPRQTPELSQQMIDRAKSTAGTWRCDGSGMGMDGKAVSFGGTYRSKPDLDGSWIHNSFAGTLGSGKSAMKYKFEAYATWDPGTKRWREVFVDNFGDQTLSGGAEMKDGKLDITGESLDMLGRSTIHDHLDASDATRLQFRGEQSRDGGKTWQNMYEMTCKK